MLCSENSGTLDINAVQNVQDDSFNDSPVKITEIDVYQILSKINLRKASGPPGLPNWLLREYTEVLSFLNQSVLFLIVPF